MKGSWICVVFFFGLSACGQHEGEATYTFRSGNSSEVYATEIARFNLPPVAETAGYVLRTTNLSMWSDTVLRVWKNGEEIAVNDNVFAGITRSEVSLIVAAGEQYEVFIHTAPGTPDGHCDVEFVKTATGEVVDLGPESSQSFGGAHAEVPAGSYDYRTALRPGGARETLLLAVDGSGAGVALDQGSGPEGASWVAGQNEVTSLVIGAIQQPGPVGVLANDLEVDEDGDGLGAELEQSLGTCDLAADCPDVFDPTDSDRDGLTDFEEVVGLDGVATVLNFPRMGANPLHKDIFVEVDWQSPHLNADLNPEQLEAIKEYFAFAPADHVGNPDGEDGVAVHLDVGLEPGVGDDPSLYGDWGGSSHVPLGEIAFEVGLSEEREGRFVHAIHNASGNGSGGRYYGPGFVFSLGWGDPKNQTLTFVHELGHALGIDHEGAKSEHFGVNCSPAYPSLMNYAYGLWQDRPGFSEGDFASTIVNAASLCEEEGLGGANRDHLSAWKITPVPGSDGVDWNRDGEIFGCDRRVRAPITWTPGGPFCGRQTVGMQQPADGTRPSLARAAHWLYLVYRDASGQIAYLASPHGSGSVSNPQFPESGCPYGYEAENGEYCNSWWSTSTLPSEVTVSDVDSFSYGGSVYVSYVIEGSREIFVMRLTPQATGELVGSGGPVPLGYGPYAPAMSLIESDPSNPVLSGQHIIAMWEEDGQPVLQWAALDVLSGHPADFVHMGDVSSSTVAGIGELEAGGPLPAMAYAVEPSGVRTYLAAVDDDTDVVTFEYDGGGGSWYSRKILWNLGTNGATSGRLSIAARALLDSNGQPIDSKYELQVAWGRPDGGPMLSRSSVLGAPGGPIYDSGLVTHDVGRIGQDAFLAEGAGGAVDLFTDPQFPFLKAVVQLPNEKIAFLPYADGVFDVDNRNGSDFKVMERGICLAARTRIGDGVDRCGDSSTAWY